jgi:hypothetical protein
MICSLLLWESGRTQSSVRGMVTDEGGHALASASVLLLNAGDSILVKGTITNPTGQYYFSNIKEGHYLLKITHAGFDDSHISPFSLANAEDKEIPGIRLSASVRQLTAVTVGEKKPLFEQRPDRMIVNVQNSIVSAGSSVLQILQRSPGVVVDIQNSMISMNGKEGVTIMVNGKVDHTPMPALLQLLGGMSSGNIEKIELIYTPSSKMDAEGAAGVINIVLKKNDKYGTNGNFSTTLGYSKNLVAAANLNFNRREGKINTYGAFSWSLLHSRQEFMLSHQTDNLQKLTRAATSVDRDETRYILAGSLGMDYEWNTKTVLGVLVSGFDNKFVSHSVNNGLFSGNGQPDTLLLMSDQESNDWKNFSGNLNLQHRFSKSEKIEFNADYIYFLDIQPVDYQSSFYNEQNALLFSQQMRSRKNTPIRFWIGALDLSLKPAKNLNLQTGLKASYSSFYNTVEVDSLYRQKWSRIENFSTDDQLKEFIPAAYVSADYALTGKTTINGGLRYEFTHTAQDSGLTRVSFNHHYGYLFPTIVLTHRPDPLQSWSLSYSRRITRPTYTDMALCVIFFDPWSLFAGNPALLPAISGNISVNYSFSKYSLSLGYNSEKNTIATFFPAVDSLSNIETSIARNLRNKQTFSAVITLPVDIAPWWSVNCSVTGLLQHIGLMINNSPYGLTQNSIHVTLSQDFKLGKGYSAELSGFYQSTSFFWDAYIVQPYGELNAGVRKKLGAGSGVLGFSAENILNSNLYRIGLHIPQQNLSVSDRLRFDYPVCKITYTRSFGKNSIRESRKRTTGAEDEQQRVRQ